MLRYVLVICLLLVYLYKNSYFNSIALTELSQEFVVSKLGSKKRTGCPVTVFPNFDFEDKGGDLDSYKVQRQLLLDIGFGWKEAAVLLGYWRSRWSTFSVPIVRECLYREMDLLVGWVNAVFQHPEAEFLFGKLSNVHLYGVYIAVTQSLIDLCREMLPTIMRGGTQYNNYYMTRVIVCVYAVDETISQGSPEVDAFQDSIFFFIWTVAVLIFQESLGVWDKAIQWTQKPDYQIYRTPVLVGYTVFVFGTLLHVFALLSYIILPKAHLLMPVYAVMLTADVLRLLMVYIYHCLATFRRLQQLANREHNVPDLSVTVVHMAKSLFEALFIGSAIYHGLYVRGRLFVIFMAPYLVNVLRSVFAFHSTAAN